MTLNSSLTTLEEGGFSNKEQSDSLGSEKSYHVNSDMDLVKAVVNGDMFAFEELYNIHHRRVYSLCLRMLQNTHEAEDLTQIVFLQLFRKINTFRGDSAFSTWLHRMTVNQVLMHFRIKRNTYELVTEDGIVPEVRIVNSKELMKVPINDKIALEQAIDQLPSGYKNTFILHDVYGYEHEEVAKIMGCSVGTSKSQLHKARLKLKKLIKKKANPRLIRPAGNEKPFINRILEAVPVAGITPVLSGKFSVEEALALADLAYMEEVY